MTTIDTFVIAFTAAVCIATGVYRLIDARRRNTLEAMQFRVLGTDRGRR